MEGFDEVVAKALDDFQVPGVGIGVIVDGHLVYAKGIGYRDLENKVPVTPDTLFAIGSCTKAFTAFIVGSLIDEGLLSWDEFVIDVLPEFRLWDQYATQNLKIRDLLTHRTGMPRHDFMWYNSALTRLEVMKRLRFLEPSLDIRERYQYNNLMYLTAGYAIEQMTGKTWEEIVIGRILKPLGMNHTNFSIDAMQQSHDFSYPYLERGKQLRRIPFRNISVIGPAGSINSSVNDLAQWIQMQMNRGVFNDQILISPSTLQEMHSPQVIIPGVPESKESLLYAYGIGWAILSYKGHYYVSHDGGVDGFTSVVGFLPHEKVGLIILCNKNLTTLPRYLSLQIIDKILNIPSVDWLAEGVDGIRKYQETMKEKRAHEDMMRKKGTNPSHALEEYVGEYEHPGYGKVNIDLVDGKLRATFNGIACLLDHWHYDIFTVSDEAQDLIISLEGMKFTFRNSIDGEIAELTIPFEPTANDVVYKRKPTEVLSTTAYLRQFVGNYEIYGYTVEIILRDRTLAAIIPGQPCYELVPHGENEFTVKSMTGYTVRFIMDPERNLVEEVLLIQPYGAFRAKPKNLP
ncbi:MAG: hypothetical protein A3E80_06735 [Chlamydiae bacterium RIFCSPHIGHO2_12_FULL_49_9]|nr:MAG: hypothetical protein A3E80_06735 [Chlamydiae bacterium RIFCSPHIGHO2_12_FULL_49_9]